MQILNTYHREQTEAVQIMLTSTKRVSSWPVFTSYEIAETKVALVENLARQPEYPLKCTMEEA